MASKAPGAGRGLLGKSGRRRREKMGPWLLGAVLQLFMAVSGPSHMHGTAATQAPDKRVPPLPWWWSHSNPNPSTWVGWVGGGQWGKADHRVALLFSARLLITHHSGWRRRRKGDVASLTVNYPHSQLDLLRSTSFHTTSWLLFARSARPVPPAHKRTPPT